MRLSILALTTTTLLVKGGDGGIVMDGYDVVEYFSLNPEDSGVKGDNAYKFIFNTSLADGTQLPYEFHFQSEENLQTFKSEPWRYAPRYGGF